MSKAKRTKRKRVQESKERKQAIELVEEAKKRLPKGQKTHYTIRGFIKEIKG